MLPVNLLNALKEYALTQRTPLPVAAADPAAKNTPQFDQGQKLQGNVLAQVAPNVFKVNVAGQQIQMQLPPFVRSGDTIALQVVSLQPRLTFSMINSAAPLASPERLGSAARLLSSMSQQAPDKAYVRAPQSAPLWEAPRPPESKQLAGALHEALSNSGLFYEAHQAQWLGGERSTAQLLHEPQNMPPEQARAAVGNASLNARTNTADAAVNGQPTTTGGEAATKVSVSEPAAKLAVQTDLAGKAVMESGDGTPVRIAGNGADVVVTSQPSTGSAEAKPVSIPEHLQPLVQQQLNALETRQMMWQGHVWPGQEMKWEVHEQAPRAAGAEAQQRQWVTQIQMDLPKLGAVAATLRFNSAGLSLTLNADNEQTRAVLGGARSRLVSALSGAGISVLSAQVGSERQGGAS